METKKEHLKIFFIIALTVGIFGIVLSAFLASFAFLMFSLPNLSLAAFFGYKYYKIDKATLSHKKGRSRDRH